MSAAPPESPARPTDPGDPRELPAIGRIVALPRPGEPPRLCLYRESRLLELAAEPSQLAGLAVGDVVAFTLAAPDRLGRLSRLGGPAQGAWRDGGDALRWRAGPAPEGGESVESRMERLRRRHRIVTALRAWFDEEGFIEAETPVLVRAPSPEPQFEPFAAGDGYLITSPEFQLKRMVVGGFEKVYRLGPVFRGGETGRLHNPEFTLLEWYRAGAGLEAMARDLEALLAATLPLATARDGQGRLRVAPDPFLAGEPVAVEISPPFECQTVAGLFQRHLGLELTGSHSGATLRQAARRAGVTGAEELPEEFEPAFFALWNRFEHELGRERPLLVTEWPAPLASLARLKPGDPTVAERMELLLGGIELANGFAELTDAAEQRRRFEADLAQRRAQGRPPVPLDERFLEALGQGMPPAAGMALGVDRLVMVLTGATHIRQVLPFAWDER